MNTKSLPHAWSSRGVVSRHPTIAFVAIAYGLSWLAWLPLVIAHFAGTKIWPYLHLIGGLGPMIAAIALTSSLAGSHGVRHLLGRLIPAREQVRWLLLAILFPVALFGGAVAINRLFGEPWPSWSEIGATVDEYPGLPRPAYWIASFLFYGVGEEVGWRGFLLPRLQQRRSIIRATLLVAAIWSAWHLPLFVFSAGYASMGAAGFLGWFVSMVTGAVLMTWLYNASRASLLAVALFHGVLDILINSPIGPRVQTVMSALLTLAGLAILTRLRERTRTRIV